MFATAAARALADVDGMDAEAIGRKAMGIAADMCVYTNHNFVCETITQGDDAPDKPADAAADSVSEPADKVVGSSQ